MGILHLRGSMIDLSLMVIEGYGVRHWLRWLSDLSDSNLRQLLKEVKHDPEAFFVLLARAMKEYEKNNSEGKK